MTQYSGWIGLGGGLRAEHQHARYIRTLVALFNQLSDFDAIVLNSPTPATSAEAPSTDLSHNRSMDCPICKLEAN